jgi:hypothetical protein
MNLIYYSYLFHCIAWTMDWSINDRFTRTYTDIYIIKYQYALHLKIRCDGEIIIRETTDRYNRINIQNPYKKWGQMTCTFNRFTNKKSQEGEADIKIDCFPRLIMDHSIIVEIWSGMEPLHSISLWIYKELSMKVWLHQLSLFRDTTGTDPVQSRLLRSVLVVKNLTSSIQWNLHMWAPP